MDEYSREIKLLCIALYYMSDAGDLIGDNDFIFHLNNFTFPLKEKDKDAWKKALKEAEEILTKWEEAE